MSEEIKIDWMERIRKLHDVLKFKTMFDVAATIKEVFPEAFQRKERKLELTEEHLGEVWKIAGMDCILIRSKYGIETLQLSNWCIYDRERIAYFSEEFLAPSLAEYLKMGGKVC